MTCPDENQVSEFALGVLGADARAAIEGHLDECAECRVLVSDLVLAGRADAVPVSKPTRMMVGKAETEANERNDEDEDAASKGRVVGGRYTLIQRIGSGGMGAVWVATDRKLDRPVALKLMRRASLATKQAKGRFEREAKAVARLRSPYIVQVHDYGIDDGAPYMVMELLDGHDLSHRLDQRGSLPVMSVARIVVQVCKALTTAHAERIVHRDLKPGNVFLVRDGDDEIAKVVDFGVAKVASPTAGLNETTTGALLGTPRYMSPEQAHGAKAVDHRSDLWSVAVIAYRSLTARAPFRGTGVGQLINQITNERAPPPSELVPGLPEEIDQFFDKALAKDPGDRYQSARELAEAFCCACEMTLSSSEFSAIVDADAVLRERMVSSGASLSFHPTPSSTSADASDALDKTSDTLNAQTRSANLPGKRWLRPTTLAVAAAGVLLAGATIGALLVGGDRGESNRDQAGSPAPTEPDAALVANGASASSSSTPPAAASAAGSAVAEGSASVSATVAAHPAAVPPPQTAPTPTRTVAPPAPPIKHDPLDVFDKPQ